MIGTLNLTVGQSAIMAELSPSGESSSDSTAANRVEAQSSIELVRRARTGDTAAENELCVRYLPRLQRWAHGRLPAWARGALDTHDLVQDTFIQVLRRIGEFEPRHEGAFHGLSAPGADEPRPRRNPARDTGMRRRSRSIPRMPAPIRRRSRKPSGSETLERYESALAAPQARPTARQSCCASK